MQTTTLGYNGPRVSRLGFGVMQMAMKKPHNDQENIATIQAVLDAGINFIDVADFYGMGRGEYLVGRALKGRRDQAFLSVKCGAMFSPTGAFLGIDGRPEAIKNFASYSLQRLGVEVIDLYQPCRADPNVPYEETIGAIADLIKEGKVRHLGVSEVGGDLLRRAHRVHPVSALEIEYSLACRFIEAEILPTARELGIAVVPYRILADGLLSGAVMSRSTAHYAVPRMEGANLEHNLKPTVVLKALAEARGCTPAQLAVAWLLSRGEDIVPVLGMSRPDRVEENLQALAITLTADELATLDNAFAPDAIIGDRYPAMVMKLAAR
ncbi:aldo/keto reductase [Salmonella enterica]|nr:aldo/keto reductase [Salmonella enterica]EFP4635188.1 aldo/keto reductase [Salmonella enterica]EFS0363648.1 aldo/keto reductase [Salmonella enterica]EGK1505958.1 aldo/keto reductase [Salmonella enterica]